MRTQLMLAMLVMVLSVVNTYAIDMSGFNLTEDSPPTVATNVNQERVKIIWLQVQMRRIESQIDIALKQRDKFSEEARNEILSARRAAANARAAGDALALLIGGASAVGERVSGSYDTSASFELTNDLLNTNARYSNYSAASRMQGANATANGLYSQAQSYGAQANDLLVQRQQVQSQLDRCVIEYLVLVNQIISNIPGFQESGFGHAKDLAFNPEAGKDKAFDGALIYSLTFVIEEKPVDIRITDLEQMIGDDFASIIADRKKALEAAKEFEYDKYLAGLKNRLKEIDKEIEETKEEKSKAAFFSDERSELAKKVRKLEREKMSVRGDINALKSKNWFKCLENVIDFEVTRKDLAKREKAAKAEATANLEFVKRAKAMVNKMNKDELVKALEQIKGLI